MIVQLLSVKKCVNCVAINSTLCIKNLKTRDICTLHKFTSIDKENVNKEHKLENVLK